MAEMPIPDDSKFPHAERRTLDCSVLTPEGPVFRGEAISVVAPGADGYLGILFNHAPIITALGKGTLKVTGVGDAGTQTWTVEGGFMEVLRNKVSVLAHRILK